MQPRVLAATESRVECELHANHPLRLTGAEGRRVQCVSGVIWITAYDESRDIFLRPGDSYTIRTNRLVLAEAVDTCRMQVELPREFGYAPSHAGLVAAFTRFAREVPAALFRRRQATESVQRG